MSDYILDTDVMVDILREVPVALLWFGSLPDNPSVSCFTALELLSGSRDMREYNLVDKMLVDFSVLYPAMSDMEAAVFQLSPLSLSKGIGDMDLLIAATAIGHNMTLVSKNLKHFKHVPGLSVVRPY